MRIECLHHFVYDIPLRQMQPIFLSVINVFSYFLKSSPYHCNQYVISSCPVPYPPFKLPCPNGQLYDDKEAVIILIYFLCYYFILHVQFSGQYVIVSQTCILSLINFNPKHLKNLKSTKIKQNIITVFLSSPFQTRDSIRA